MRPPFALRSGPASDKDLSHGPKTRKEDGTLDQAEKPEPACQEEGSRFTTRAVRGPRTRSCPLKRSLCTRGAKTLIVRRHAEPVLIGADEMRSGFVAAGQGDLRHGPFGLQQKIAGTRELLVYGKPFRRHFQVFLEQGRHCLLRLWRMRRMLILFLLRVLS